MLLEHSTPHRRRHNRRRVVTVVCALGALLASCSHGGSSKSSAASSPSTVVRSSSAARRTRLLTIGSVNVQQAGKSVALSATTRRAVLRTAQKYVDSAILEPLETGRLGRNYATVFAPGIRPAAVGPDRRVLTELGAGKTTTFTESSTPIAVSALADPSGTLLYAATSFHVKVTATIGAAAVTLDHAVELTLEPVDKSWLVVAYRTTVKRTGPTVPHAKPKPKAKPKATTTSTTTSTTTRKTKVKPRR